LCSQCEGSQHPTASRGHKFCVEHFFLLFKG
jgi:hypothetical protein